MDEKDFELAEAITQQTLDIALARARQKTQPPADFKGKCACGARVPKLRIAAGYYNCIECKKRQERQGYDNYNKSG